METGIKDLRMAIYYSLAAVFVFSVMGACIKALTIAQYAVVQIVFFRCLFGFGPVLYMLFKQNAWHSLISDNISGHLSRGLIGTFAMLLSFWTYSFLPLADATALQFIAPIAMTMLAVPLLGEKVGIWRWGGILIGFLGVMVMVQPGNMGNTPESYIGLTIGLCAAVMTALAMIIVKKLGETEPSVAIVFYFTLISTIGAAIFLPSYWQMPHTGWDWYIFIMTGLLGGIGQIFTTRSYDFAPAAIVSPFSYLSIIFAVGFGYFFFGEVPDMAIFIGSAIVIISGLFILWREFSMKSDMPRLTVFGMQPARPTKADHIEDIVDSVSTPSHKKPLDH